MKLAVRMPDYARGFAVKCGRETDAAGTDGPAAERGKDISFDREKGYALIRLTGDTCLHVTLSLIHIFPLL